MGLAVFLQLVQHQLPATREPTPPSFLVGLPTIKPSPLAWEV